MNMPLNQHWRKCFLSAQCQCTLSSTCFHELPMPIARLTPVYLGVTPLSHREDLRCAAAKLKCDRETRLHIMECQCRYSALTLCYSVTENCCPAWPRSCHTNLIDTQQRPSLRVHDIRLPAAHSSSMVTSACQHIL